MHGSEIVILDRIQNRAEVSVFKEIFQLVFTGTPTDLKCIRGRARIAGHRGYQAHVERATRTPLASSSERSGLVEPPQPDKAADTPAVEPIDQVARWTAQRIVESRQQRFVI